MPIRPVSNVELWNAIRSKFPQFASHTAQATKETFTERGFEAIRQLDPTQLDEWYGLSLRVTLQFVNSSDARDPFQDAGFGESYDVPFGSIIQRMSVNAVKPVSPIYRGLVDGDSPDPFVVKKADADERFFRQNFDYQALLTVPDDYVMKQIFISDTGMSDYMAGIMNALNTAYTVQKYENKKEALNALINSTKFPLQDTQKMTVTIADTNNPTDAELTNFILGVKNVLSAMTAGTQSSAFNSYKFKTVQDKSRLKMLIRTGFKNAIDVRTLTGAFNPEKLNLDIDTIEVTDFGGLKPTYRMSEEETAPCFPVYDELGSVVGFNSEDNATEVTITEDQVIWEDPNADVIAVIADKGIIFEGIQNPYRVEPIRNPRGLYTNYWASSPGNTIAIDPLYNCVIIRSGQ